MNHKLIGEMLSACTVHYGKPHHRKTRWFHRVCVAFSQLINAILGGSPDETFSSRVYRAAVLEKRGAATLKWIIDTVFFFEYAHCYIAWCDEVSRRHVNASMRAEQDKYAKYLQLDNKP